MSSLLISLGANLGNSYETMLAASMMLRDAFSRDRVRFSRLYRTPPVGGPSGQADFLNAVASIQTERSSWEVWEVIKRIEKDLGRERQQRWEARRLDIDILLHGTLRIWTPHLKIPHPRMCMRSFVLVPALEIAAEVVEPVTGWTIGRLHSNLLLARESTIEVWSNSNDACRELETTLIDTGSRWNDRQYRLACCPNPDQILAPDVGKESGHLKIYCIRTPEPETIQWEDFLFPWAKALGLAGAPLESKVAGLRYLLPNHDPRWTAHEILASRSAMNCPIYPIDRPFGEDST